MGFLDGNGNPSVFENQQAVSITNNVLLNVPYAPITITSAQNVVLYGNQLLNSSCQYTAANLAYSSTWYQIGRPINVYDVSQALIAGNSQQADAGCALLNVSLPVAVIGGSSGNVTCC